MSGRKVDWEAVDDGESIGPGPTNTAPAMRPASQPFGELEHPTESERHVSPSFRALDESIVSKSATTFDADFAALTGKEPFPWQRALFLEFVRGRFPGTCDIPTGLGKTSTVAIWLLALSAHARARSRGFPRRLVYVVNRRTVVDQATRESELLRAALVEKPALVHVAAALRALAVRADGPPLAVSTLRGQFADNGEWRDDPSRPAIIIGTVDMIGSRLLFSGYGCGFKSKPTHAGLLGQDALLIHDEAHLEPAFQALALAIEAEQRKQDELGRLQVLALTATSRGGGEPFRLATEDLKHEIVRTRFRAKKHLRLHSVTNEKDIADEVARCALEHRDGGKAVLVFLRSLEGVMATSARLRKECSRDQVQQLTGTLRGLERDALAASDPIFARFKPGSGKDIEQTVYLVCTSAGEVGVDISADHMVCDLTPFDSMAQRLGRVNRYGGGEARVDVVVPRDFGEKDPLHAPRQRTLALLEALPTGKGGHDASPAALAALPSAERLAAFTPEPTIPPTTDILLDAWALTSIRERLPGRPPVATWLHGIESWEPPETHVAWREEVAVVDGGLAGAVKPEELLADYPLKPHELLRDRTDRVMVNFETLAERFPEAPVWIVGADDEVRALPMAELVKKDRQNKYAVSVQNCTVLLPPHVGGLSQGMLDGSAEPEKGVRYDVADEWKDQKGELRRRRIWDDEEAPQGMRLVRTIDTRPPRDDEMEETEDEESPRRFWRWFIRPRSADDDGSFVAQQRQGLTPHLEAAERHAVALVANLGLPPSEALAVRVAARFHDSGKRRAIWQRAIGNRDPHVLLAKSDGKMQIAALSAYRHELGSMVDLSSEPEVQHLSPDVMDLVLHLVAAHHGRARPHFPEEEVFDPEHEEMLPRSIAEEVPRRFGRLQRKYGRWGLAYLESLVRAADVLASQGADAGRPGVPSEDSIGTGEGTT